MPQRLAWHFLTRYGLPFMVATALVGAATALVLERDLRTRLQGQLEGASLLLRDRLRDVDSTSDPARLQQLCEEFAKRTGNRAAVMTASGRVLADSFAPPEPSSAEDAKGSLQTALAKVSPRTRSLMDHRAIALTLTLPMASSSETLGVLTTSMPSTDVGRHVQRLRWQIAAASGLVCLLGMGMALALARRVRLPVEAMRQGAQRFAGGELGHRLDLPTNDELSVLAGVMNQMAHQLEQRMSAMSRRASEQEAVLASMVEGVLAVDPSQRVISINAAAASLLGTAPTLALGRGLQEVIRNTDLIRFVARTLECDEPVEDDVVLRRDDERVLQARGTSLENVAGKPVGAVVVLHDVTRIRKLETLRRDFVANVSHELKTPVTSIKGFVETLLEGAVHQPEDAERFLRIILRQADRLNAIIEDLLCLAKIEQSAEAVDVPLQEVELAVLLRSAIDECSPQATQRQTPVRLECDAALSAAVNAPLLEQAIINLLDNAIKYSEPGGEIVIHAAGTPGEVVIQVRDQGCGIEPEHFDRLFERFYRVDKARSRKFGGTGLGLAIVKHIVHVHGGHVTVASAPGKGSEFSIHLPRA